MHVFIYTYTHTYYVNTSSFWKQLIMINRFDRTDLYILISH